MTSGERLDARAAPSGWSQTILAYTRVTIRDVAEQAGVSPSTVSRVLSEARTEIAISDETRQRVERIARNIGYRPHPAARSLTGKRTGLIGLIVREIGDPFFAQLIDTIGRAAKEHDYDIVLGNAMRDPRNALALGERMLDLRYCDGILLCGDLRESPDIPTLGTMVQADYPLVSVSRGGNELVRDTPSVGTDNVKGVHLALDHLLKLGHRRIACFNAGRFGDLWERVAAYREFVQQQLGAVDEQLVQPAVNSYDGGYQAAERLLKLQSPPTAIFAMDDVMAIGALGAAIDLGWAVPDQVSIVGFDGVDLSACIRPALTTVLQGVDEIGRVAVELLSKAIDGETGSVGCPHVLVEPELVVRASCGPSPGP
jgi:LacI family transcriptional regulator